MKKRLSIGLVVLLTVILLLLSSTSVVYGLPPIHKYKMLSPMTYYEEETPNCCGPRSGPSIGQYYEDNYPDLPSASVMCDRLYAYMDTISGWTNWNNYGPGFVELALHYGYDNFDYIRYDDDTVPAVDTEGFYLQVIKPAIDNGWPVALASIDALNGWTGVEEIETNGDEDEWPPGSWHWIAIRGYEYMTQYGQTWAERIIATDNNSEASELVLAWDDIVDVVGDDLVAIVIKDVDGTPDSSFVEDFEWGDDEDDLADWLNNDGEVDWEVTASAPSVVKIDDEEHCYGDQSARFYTYTSTASAYYKLIQPYFIGFALKKEDDAQADFRIGNGQKAIWFTVNEAEEVRYYDGSWHTVYTIPYVEDWCLIEFDDFNWGLGTFDIWVNYYKRADDAEMRDYSGYDGIFKIINPNDYSTFWIDRIDDTMVYPG